MNLSNDRVKINFPLVGENYVNCAFAVESLWAKPCGDNVYQIDNIPFYVKRLSSGDLVKAEPDGQSGTLVYKEHVAYSKHSTLRVFFFDKQIVSSTRGELNRMGCQSEGSHNRQLISVDVPPTADFEAVIKYLAEGESKGCWDYEEAAVWT